MRVLLVHNHYSSLAPSGENRVFELEFGLLSRNGVQVETFERRSDTIRGWGWAGMLWAAATTPWNPFSARAVRRAVERFRPDVVHAHNTFPLLSPSIFPGVGHRAGRVLTLHNFRLFCAAGTAFREGLPCTQCLDRRSAVPAMVHGCYRGSRLATLPVAAGLTLARARRVWQQHVEAFIALTDFQRTTMIAAGLPADRVFVKPNFYPGRPVVRSWQSRLPTVVYVGRLSEEKGVRHLVDAWLSWGAEAPVLRIVGDGPLRASLQRRARSQPRVEFVGQLEAVAAHAEISTARLLVIPSVWYEGFPLVLQEAFANGTPVAASDIGPFPALLQGGRAGLLFRPGDSVSIRETLRVAWLTPGVLESLSAAGRLAFEQEYAEEGNFHTLIGIYQSAMARRKESA